MLRTSIKNHPSSNMHWHATHVACQEEVAERDARRARDVKAVYFNASRTPAIGMFNVQADTDASLKHPTKISRQLSKL